MTSPGAARVIGLSSLVLLAGFVGWSWAFALEPRGDRDTDEKLRAAAQRLERAAAPGDLVLLSPVWELGGMEAFRPLPRDVYEKLEPSLAQKVHRVWMIVAPGGDAPEKLAAAAGGSFVLEEELREGRIRLLRYRSTVAHAPAETPPIPIAPATQTAAGRALVERLGEAVVTARPLPAGGEESCPSRSGRFQCAGHPDWFHVERQLQPIGATVRRCIWAHPRQGYVRRIAFPGQTLGEALAGHHGLVDGAAGGGTLAPIRFRVTVAGQKRHDGVQADAPGWNDWRVDTRALRGTTAEVAFEIEATHDGRRHFCFDAEIVGSIASPAKGDGPTSRPRASSTPR